MVGLCRIISDPAAGHRIAERIYTVADGLASDRLISLFESSAGRLWVGTFGGLSELLQQAPGRSKALQTYTMANGLTSEEAAVKLLYLALRNVIRKWDTVQSWKQALNHFEMLWGDRIQAALSR